MKKKLLSLTLILSLIFLVFSGCGQTGNSADGKGQVIHDSEEYPSKENEETAISEPVQENGESAASGTAQEDAKAVPVVYMTTDISPEGLAAVYEALGGNVAVKLSTGEPPASPFQTILEMGSISSMSM